MIRVISPGRSVSSVSIQSVIYDYARKGGRLFIFPQVEPGASFHRVLKDCREILMYAQSSDLMVDVMCNLSRRYYITQIDAGYLHVIFKGTMGKTLNRGTFISLSKKSIYRTIPSYGWSKKYEFRYHSQSPKRSSVRGIMGLINRDLVHGPNIPMKKNNEELEKEFMTYSSESYEEFIVLSRKYQKGGNNGTEKEE